MGSDSFTARVPPLIEGNYEAWRIVMEAVLVAQDLWEHVGPERPDLVVKGPKAVQAREMKKSLAKARIVLTLDPTQLPFIAGLDDPRRIWDTLESMHRSNSVNSTLSLRRRFFNMSKRESESTMAWISRVRQVAIELSHTAAPATNLDIILVMTDGLPQEFAPVITSLDALSPEQLTMPFVIARINGFEAQIAPHSEREDPYALAARINNSAQCWNCSGFGHGTDVCPSTKNPDRVQENLAKHRKKKETSSEAAKLTTMGLGYGSDDEPIELF